MNHKLNAEQILELMPPENCRLFQVGIAPVSIYGEYESIFIKDEAKASWDKYSGPPSDFMPEARSVIVLIQYSPTAKDYRVEDFILILAEKLWKVYGIYTHLIENGQVNNLKLVGVDLGPAARSWEKMFILKDAAYYAGLGQFSRCSLLINPHFGSDFKIQALLSDAEFSYNKPLEPVYHPTCKTCTTCAEKCPSGAISEGYNKERCLVARPQYMPDKYVVSRIPLGYWSVKQECLCRVCQAFCPLNSGHYRDKLICYDCKNDRVYYE